MKEDKELAFRLIKEHRFQEAIPLLQNAIRDDSKDWNSYFLLGQCFRFQEDYKNAIEYLKKAAKINPKEAEIFLALGIAYQLTSDFNSAVDYLKQAIKIDPDMMLAYNSLGLTYRKMGKLTLALELYRKAADLLVKQITDRLFEDSDRCYETQIVNGKKTMVLRPYFFKQCHDMLKKTPEYSIIKNNIGTCLINLGDRESARTQLLESIEFIPDGYNYPDPYRNLESLG